MTQLKLGDKGIAVEYLNSFFGIDGSVYTDETVTCVKQFQVAYNQRFYQDPNAQYTEEDVFNQYSRLDEDGNVVLGKYLPILYPTGIVDIRTMTAILDTNIDYNDNYKIKQVQLLLLQNGFYDSQAIFEMLCELAADLKFRYDSNVSYIPTLVNGEVRRIVNSNETLSGTELIQERSDLPNTTLADFSVLGKTTYVSKRYADKTGDTISTLDGSNESLKQLVLFGNSVSPSSVGTSSPAYLPYLSDSKISFLSSNLLTREICNKVLDALAGESMSGFNYDTSVNATFTSTSVTSPIPTTSSVTNVNSSLRQCFMYVYGMRYASIYKELEVVDGTGSSERYVFADQNWNIISDVDYVYTQLSETESGTYTSTVLIPADAHYMCYEFYNKPSSTVRFKNVGVYESLSTVDLSPLSAIKLYSLPNKLDELDIIRGIFCSRIGTSVLIGGVTEGWYITADAQGTNRFTILIPNSNLVNSFCSHYTSSGSQRYLAESNIIHFYDPSITTLDDWKSFLQSQSTNDTPLTVWFEKVKETYSKTTEIADLTLNNSKEIICNNSSLRVVFPKKDTASDNSSDIITPVSYMPITLTGAGSSNNLVITSMDNNGNSVDVSVPYSEINGLFSTSTSFDKLNLTTGKLTKNVTKLTLTGNEDTIIVSQNTNSKEFISFSFNDVLPSRYFMDAGYCNYFKANDDAWKGESEGYCFELGAPKNVYISVACKTLGISKYEDGPSKITALRQWLRGLNSAGNPVTIYFRSAEETVTNITPRHVPQFSNYTKIVNNFNVTMMAVFKLSVSIERGSVILKGLFDEGLVDLTKNIDTLEVTGYYDKQTIQAIRLYQKTYNLGQIYDDGLVYYSGILDIPTYNHMKQVYGITEVVT